MKLRGTLKSIAKLSIANFFHLRGSTWASPTAQMFINTDKVSTRICITNFSIFDPDNYTRCEYIINIFNSNGRLVVTKKYDLKKHASLFVEIKDFLDPSIKNGMFTALIKSQNKKNKNQINRFKSHTYAIFHTPKTFKSIGIVHPQTAPMKSFKGDTGKWTSNQIVETDNIKKIGLLFFNPNTKKITLDLELLTKNMKSVLVKKMNFNKNATKYFETSEVCKYKSFRIQTSRLTTPNAKPLLILYFNDGTFSISHT